MDLLFTKVNMYLQNCKFIVRVANSLFKTRIKKRTLVMNIIFRVKIFDYIFMYVHIHIEFMIMKSFYKNQIYLILVRRGSLDSHT